MATSTATIPRIDTRFNKFSQAGVVLLAAVAFLTNQHVIVLVAAVVLGLSALAPAIGPFRLLYRYLVVPLRLITPRLIESHYENNYGGALNRLNAITEKLESLDFSSTPRFNSMIPVGRMLHSAMIRRRIAVSMAASPAPPRSDRSAATNNCVAPSSGSCRA